jgi:hypothetical protein
MRSFGRTSIGLGGLILVATGCNDDVGYVEVKTFPGFNVPLYLDTVKLAVPFKNGTTIVSQHVGKATLQLEHGGQFLPICEFEVRKNRILTVKLSVSTFERLPRCELKK